LGLIYGKAKLVLEQLMIIG